MPDIRNIAIIAHVDHGKTTLVDFLLRQAGTWASHEQVGERVMDSGDLERERGITILSKCTAVTYQGVRINIVDTPGHADFGGEVERILMMVDGVLLLVDASEGPLPQTRFVLRKALEAGLKVIVVINKIDRPDARIPEVQNEIYDLFIDLGADDKQIEFPLFYAIAKAGTCTASLDDPQENLIPLFEAIIKQIPAPKMDTEGVLQLVVTQLDHDPYVGRLAIGRIRQGTLRQRDEVGLIDIDGRLQKVKVNQLYIHQGLKRVEISSAPAGEIVALAGIDGINIGDSLTDVEHPSPLPRVKVEEPTIGVIFMHNDSPLSGQDGKYVTARRIRERLEKELLHNVALRMEPCANTESMKIFGRGELQLCILVEQMRREGFELCLSKPEVVRKERNGTWLEPWEIATLDFPETFMGVVTQKMAYRKGRLTEMKAEGGRVRLTFRVPSRGLIGFRGEYLNDTRGLGVLNTLFDSFDEEAGFIRYRLCGSIVADRLGDTTAYALFHLQPRGKLFVSPGVKVYEGMIVGENSRENDLNVNVARAKQLTNFRTTSADEKLVLTPPVQLTLEKALEFIDDDELVEVTPLNIRLRKKILAGNMRSIVRGPRREESE